MYLLLSVKGGAHGWRLDYTYGTARKTLSLGTYPNTGLALALARRKAGKAETLRAAYSFEAVAREWVLLRGMV